MTYSIRSVFLWVVKLTSMSWKSLQHGYFHQRLQTKNCNKQPEYLWISLQGLVKKTNPPFMSGLNVFNPHCLIYGDVSGSWEWFLWYISPRDSTARHPWQDSIHSDVCRASCKSLDINQTTYVDFTRTTRFTGCLPLFIYDWTSHFSSTRNRNFVSCLNVLN